MADILAAIFGICGASTQIKEYVIIPLKNQYSYLFRYKNIVEDLRVQNQELNSSRDHMQQQIQGAENNRQVILPHVRNWCGRVDEFKEKADRILGDEQQDQNGACMHGTCPNLKLRYSLSREAMKLTKVFVELQKEYREFGSHISDPAPLMAMETIPATSDTLELDSRRYKEEEIMSYLRNNSIRLIGVWGMGGVGKTTMAKKIAKKAIDEKLFDQIVMAVVSQPVDIPKIQQQLAEGLGLHLTQGTESVRATQLQARLEDKKVLIILDDVWERLDPEGEVGIPSQIKILLTSRDHDVCNTMSREGDTKILALEVLDAKEALSLFRENAGSVVDQSNLLPLAIDVAAECKGLPLALVTVGKSLRGKTNEAIWKDSLRQLRTASPENIRGYLEGVFRPLKLSYEHLESDEAKYLFLLCCLFPEDSEIEIENLVRYGVGLRIFSATESIKDARNRVHYLVETLIDRCLLIDAGEEPWPTYVKMHDVIRDMALSIASSGKHVFMVSHDRGLREWPGNDSGEDYTCISLTPGEALAFTECIRCPRLNALLLIFDSSTPALKLPVNFLNETADLRLLSIQHKFVDVSFLSPLKNLRALHLNGCYPENICLIGQLVSLEILSCRGSGIRELPNEIGELVKLKLLDLTDSQDLWKVAPGVISKLVQLEELRLMKCPIEWEGEEGQMRSNASLAEVFSLRNLRFLEIWILDAGVISQETNGLQNLTSYFIFIGELNVRFELEGSYTDLKRMQVRVVKSKVSLNAISLARQEFKRIKHLKIEGLDSVKNLAPGSDIFPVLRHLDLRGMDDLEEICHGPPSVGSFSQLEYLSLYHLRSLLYLWKSGSEKLCLSNLKDVKIWGCKNLKWVFPLSIAESLRRLQSIEVEDCPMMEEVFKDERGSETGVTTSNHIEFPSLNRMTLRRLPMLCALCKAVDVFEFPSMKTLKIWEVSTEIFSANQLGQVTWPNLSNLELTGLGMERICREVQISMFSKLEVLKISSFDNLRTLFSLDIFRDLINLRKLTVSLCLMLECIVKVEENEDEGQRNRTSKITIPKLQKLDLSGLPKIRCFCSFSNALELPSLEVLKIRCCPMMETFALNFSCSSSMSDSSIPRFFLDKQVTCPNLSNLELTGFRMERICREVQISMFSKLEVLEISFFDNLRTLFSLDIFRDLINLRKLTVSLCWMLEGIVKVEENEDEGQRNRTSKITIPKLQKLYLSGLPKIRCFCSFSNALELPSLEVVNIQDCPLMETFALNFSCSSSMSDSSIPRFFLGKQVTCPNLSNLNLRQLRMEIICCEVQISIFNKLEVLEINYFNSLRTLFSLEVFRGLINLKTLTVSHCLMLEGIVKVEENEDEGQRNRTSKITIPKLQMLYLSELPKICCFCSFSNALELPSLEVVNIKDCPMMETFALNFSCSSSMSNSSIPRFFLGKQVTCPNLSNLNLRQLGMEIISREVQISMFTKLEVLEISSFDNLRTLFSLDIFRDLINLKELTVSRCLMLEGIVKVEENEDEGQRNRTSKIIIPKLEMLNLSELPKIRYFCSFSNALELPSLELVNIKDCPMMETFAVNIFR